MTRVHTTDFLDQLGVPVIPPSTSPFDPGYDPATVIAHLEQSSHLMSTLKISMASWIVADEDCTRRKLGAAQSFNVPTVAGGTPFEIALAEGKLVGYLDLCAAMGLTRIECGEGFTHELPNPTEIMKMTGERGLEVQIELGKKHGGTFTTDTTAELVERGREWLDAGALQVVIEARESARGVGVFDPEGNFNPAFADPFAEAFGLDTVVYEAPTKSSQFSFLDHFGREVQLCNVRLEELLRVEIYRRRLHSDAYAKMPSLAQSEDERFPR
ncbi:MAG: phosphosulfolactate synthase [Actinomycetota bacterium]|nr:phosphosulfolactate synthase [Actinomycetota bacterium]